MQKALISKAFSKRRRLSLIFLPLYVSPLLADNPPIVNDGLTSTLNKGAFSTNIVKASPLWASHNGASSNEANADTTTGSNAGQADNLPLQPPNGKITLNGDQITTWAVDNKKLFTTNSVIVVQGTLTTKNDGSSGALANESNISLSDVTIEASKKNSADIQSLANSSISGTTTITTKGESALALYANGGNVTISNSSVNTAGTQSPGLKVKDPGNSTLNLANTKLQATQSNAMDANNATITINGDGITINASNGILMSATDSTANITGTNSAHYTGQIISKTSDVNLTLSNNSTWHGSAQSLTDLNIDSTSSWEIDQNSLVTGTITNAGTITFTGPTSFKTLTFTGPYTGQENANIVLNTTLNGDNSPSDLIVITNRADGITKLTINNYGYGELTNQGILIVNGADGGVVENHSFYLGRPVIAGPYEYLLYQDGNNLYLRNTVPSDQTTTLSTSSGQESAVLLPHIPGCENGNNGDGLCSMELAAAPLFIDPTMPIYRQEVSLMTAIPTSVIAYDKLLLGNLHQRAGDTFDAQNTEPRKWVRYIYHDGSYTNNGTIYNDGPNFQFRTKITQLGGDFYNEFSEDNHYMSGMFTAIGYSHNNVDAPFVTTAGYNYVRGISLGGYFTLVNQERSYLDIVLQGTHFDIDANSTRMTTETKGNNFSGSIEGGYSIYFGKAFLIQPQAQIIIQGGSLRSTEDEGAKIHFENTTPMFNRIGLLTEYRHSGHYFHFVSLWLRGNYWHCNNVDTKTYFSSNIGDIPFNSTLPKETFEADMGITAKITENFTLFGGFSRAFFLNSHGNSSTISAGFTFHF